MYKDPASWLITEQQADDYLSQHLAAYRYEKEVGGISIDGMPIPTDDRTKTLLVGAYNDALYENDPNRLRTFKIEGNFATLTNAQVIYIALAIATHVQKCFDAEATVYQMINEGSLITEEDVENAFDEAYSS